MTDTSLVEVLERLPAAIGGASGGGVPGALSTVARPSHADAARWQSRVGCAAAAIHTVGTSSATAKACEEMNFSIQTPVGV